MLDEADQMLDMGFVVPIRRIAKTLPQQRQNLFFSATMPTEIGKLAGELLKNPAKVSVTPQATTVEKIDQKILFIEAGRKRALLAELMDDGAMKRVLIFTPHQARRRPGGQAVGYDRRRGRRHPRRQEPGPAGERSLAAFKAGDVRALVATDIAARGIDVDGVSHVIQYELPNVPEAYVHRIGRTARAGANGSAISLVADDERNLLKDIQKVTRQTIPSWDRRNDRVLGSGRGGLQGHRTGPSRSRASRSNAAARRNRSTTTRPASTSPKRPARIGRAAMTRWSKAPPRRPPRPPSRRSVAASVPAVGVVPTPRLALRPEILAS